MDICKLIKWIWVVLDQLIPGGQFDNTNINTQEFNTHLFGIITLIAVEVSSRHYIIIGYSKINCIVSVRSVSGKVVRIVLFNLDN